MRNLAHLLLAQAVVAAALLVASGAPGQVRRRSTSVGHPNDGRLVDGVRLPDEGPGYQSLRPSRPEAPNFGTEELVGALQRAGAFVESAAPGARLHIGDLSARDGGRLPRHESHQAGRDVDLLFYALDASGSVAQPRAVRYDARGRGTVRSPDGTNDEVRVFDRRRNWLALRALIEDGEAHLQRVLVSEPLRTLLLEHARERGEPAWVIERAGEVMCDTWSPHDNHFHVRLFCTAEDYRGGCRDEPPVYTWRRTELAASGIVELDLAEDPNRRSGRARRWLSSRRATRLWCP